MPDPAYRMTYRVEAVPDGPYWSVRVPALERTTQAQSRDDIEPMARDLIAITTDADPGSFAVHVVITAEAS